jgi:L-galactose dehydrogenase/L-glyceraldehyde 3-phosphate reductase
VAETFQQLREGGLTLHLGLTGIGQSEPLREVIRSGMFETVQTPYHLLNPSAGRDVPDEFPETNHGNIIAACARAGMGVLAIRALAGGALAGRPPSPHTLKTPFFTLSLYERDQRRAARIQEALGPGRRLPREAIRFVLAHPQVHSALIGFGSMEEIDEAVAAMQCDTAPLDWNEALGTA